MLLVASTALWGVTPKANRRLVLASSDESIPGNWTPRVALEASSHILHTHECEQVGCTKAIAGTGDWGFKDANFGNQSKFRFPYAVAIAPDSNFALVGDGENNRIRKVRTLESSRNGVSTVAGNGAESVINHPLGFAISADSTYSLITDTLNHKITKMTLGNMAMVDWVGSEVNGSADGIGLAAQFYFPHGIAMSPDGSYILVADTYNQLIRKVATSNAEVTTIGGCPGCYEFRDGPGTTEARFKSPIGIAIAHSGRFAVIADEFNSRIRKMDMTYPYTVTTLAGGAEGWADGVGTAARFHFPRDVALSPNDLFVLVADTHNHAIREIDLRPGHDQAVVNTMVGCPRWSTIQGFSCSRGDEDGLVNASFRFPRGIDIAPDGSYALVADTENNKIKLIVTDYGDMKYWPGYDDAHRDEEAGSGAHRANEVDAGSGSEEV